MTATPAAEVGFAREVLDVYARRGWTLAVAETDTGGLVLAQLIAEPGSSRVVLGGVVAYADRLKLEVLGVDEKLLVQHGAVSAEVAEAMARGIRGVSGADVGLATTGIAGPGGARPSKPVGLAYVAAVSQNQALVREYHWQSDRTGNRRASGLGVLQLALELAEIP